MEKPIKADYVTVWDGGETVIASRCIVDTEEKKITRIFKKRVVDSPYPNSQVDGAVENLDEEYILFDDGTRYPVVEIDDYDPDDDSETVYVRDC